jgi:hypothetical protein
MTPVEGGKMRKLFKKFCLWKCRTFGHSFRDIDVIIFKIKTNELNNDMSAILTCWCCGKEFIHINSTYFEKDGE